MFNLLECAHLPCLSWCIHLRKEAPKVDVYYGSGVETDKTYFVEGAWDDDFPDMNFDDSILMGSGGKIYENKLVLTTSSHTLERIYLLKTSDEVYASNSLSFLLSLSKRDLDLNYILYNADLNSIRLGPRECSQHIPTASGERIQLYYYCNLLINKDLSIETQPKQDLPRFTSFQQYRNFLSDTIKNLVRNAQDKARKTQYELITTVSSGYDSTASSVLAKEAGCSEAISFINSREGIAEHGSDIARMLGLNPYTFDRLAYLKLDGIPEAEFLAEGTSGEDVFMAPVEELVKDRILITGYYGGIWRRKWKVKVSKFFLRSSLAGNSLHEFRLRVGFIHVPLPFLGGINHPDIHWISHLKEMEPWVLHTQYDKPISRRIVEERGVPRDMFGQVKKAAIIRFPFESPLKILKNESREDFISFVRGIPDNMIIRNIFLRTKHTNPLKLLSNKFDTLLCINSPSVRKVVLYRLMHKLYKINNSLNSRIRQALHRIGFTIHLTSFISSRYRGGLSETSYMFHWAVTKIKQRYIIRN